MLASQSPTHWPSSMTRGSRQRNRVQTRTAQSSSIARPVMETEWLCSQRGRTLRLGGWLSVDSLPLGFPKSMRLVPIATPMQTPSASAMRHPITTGLEKGFHANDCLAPHHLDLGCAVVLLALARLHLRCDRRLASRGTRSTSRGPGSVEVAAMTTLSTERPERSHALTLERN